jgi:hypothetical protein
MTDILSSPAGDLLVAGVDCETSGNDLGRGARIIQIGLALPTEDGLSVFSSLVGWPEDSWDDTSWSPEAEAVHGITRTRLAGAPECTTVDAQACEWLTDRGASVGNRLILSVGFNVGSFDHPFIARYLPATRALLSHRCVDLNSVLFTFDGWHPDGEDGWDWLRWKSSMKADVASALRDNEGGAHDAGWDAAEALLSWRWLRERLAIAGSTAVGR